MKALITFKYADEEIKKTRRLGYDIIFRMKEN